ncbi:MAG: hypothetical protein JW994_02870 [Candidatus Omnitrophica bacterium]|nr:hypothetical protein [Candidatus Omnitrophota bacterium]
MKKLSIALLAGLLITVFTVMTSANASESVMTNAEFADLLVKTLGIELPQGSENLSAAEYYEVLANVLASKGILYFTNAKPDDPILAGHVAGILYALTGGTGDVNIDEIMKSLVDKGYIPAVDPNSRVSVAFAADVLNNPEFTSAMAEGYLPIGALPGLESPGFTLEDTPDITTPVVLAAAGTTPEPPASEQ